MLTLPDIIRKKRDGEELSDEEIKEFLNMAVDGRAEDCQIGAMLMAIYLKGLTKKETISLTTSMIESGDMMQWEKDWTLVDKHSTGGVGDKVSLPLAPALAACGCKVPMVSGRGLEITGGTLDKLESIPGFKVNLTHGELKATLQQAGCFIAGPTARLAPADKELYKRRDVTATVDSNSLIIGSIISKKVAEGTKYLVMDIKVGNAAFYKKIETAKLLGENMIEVADGLGVKCRVVLSKMDTPIGKAVGNGLEVAEAIDCLKGNGPSDLNDLVTTLGGLLLESCGKSKSFQEGKNMILQVLKNGEALNRFEKMLVCQGVSQSDAKELCHGNTKSILPAADNVEILRTKCDGYITAISAMGVGRVSWSLGAGRQKADQAVDFAVGVRLLCTEGDKVSSGQPWCEVHHRGKQLDTALRQQLEESIVIKNSPLTDKQKSPILQII
ncbi:thymidine phosphorylase-like [Schistocerca americana]|uniref:thymidine phosphorylase-like n=1 Tax=Schistocerca americana TaxID=7009 RepID=UPI001F4FBD09|nr:thymidine phosphorylase-like [Schistocerca americana]